VSLAGIYFFLAVISVLCTVAAIVQARKLYWFVPVYFLMSWLGGELAIIRLLLQLGLTSLFVFLGVLESSLAQTALGIFTLSWLGLLYLHFQATDTARPLSSALRTALGDSYREDIPSDRRQHLVDHISYHSWLKPFNFKRKGVREQRNISYGDFGQRNLLDIYHPEEGREGGFPVLLQVHGGAWMIGKKEEQGKPLMYHMAERGWLCVAINYRLSPKSAFPAHIIDVKKAIAWIRENIAEYGGNPDYIAITGGSAGGHLSSLAALTPNREEWQPGFEQIDTTVQAAVPYYAVFDFLDRNGIRAEMSMADMLADKVMQSTREENPELWDSGSPYSHVNANAPPMFVIQGTHDSLVWVEEARAFVEALKEVSQAPVAYGELPFAQHAFDIFHSIRTDHTANAVGQFLEWSHARWLNEK